MGIECIEVEAKAQSTRIPAAPPYPNAFLFFFFFFYASALTLSPPSALTLRPFLICCLQCQLRHSLPHHRRPPQASHFRRHSLPSQRPRRQSLFTPPPFTPFIPHLHLAYSLLFNVYVQMWPGLVQLAKQGGVDVIETYVFWNGHELSPDNYYFGGRYDLVKFCKIVQQAGMYMILRIGPFVAAEWNFGGVPVWLHYVPGTVFRTDSEPFKVENEYGFYESAYGEGGKRYALWAANMAVSQNTGVPWIMCQQFDPPDTVIDTCNSFYCDTFKPISPHKPKFWTENWPGWFKTFGASDPHRPPEDVAFSVARFFQKGGSLQNYYMYHGGTNFGRTSGGPFITTSYDYDAPIDEYGIARCPKWGHLKELHRSIKLCEHVLLNGEPTSLSLGPLQEADVYEDSSGACAAFIANMDDKNDKTVVFLNTSYYLPAWSVSILPDCKSVVFNTAKVGSQTSVVEMIPIDLLPSTTSPSKDLKGLQWNVFKEKAGIWGDADFTKNGLVDHINTTKDTTDYLWYTTSLLVDETEEFFRNGTNPVLVVESKGHAMHVFINQKLQASASGNGTVSPFKFKSPISLKAGKNEIALLSMTVGLQNAGAFYEWVGAGPTSVRILGMKRGTVDLSNSTWTYKIGLQGEHLRIYDTDSLNSVNWVSTSEPPKHQPLTWYKAVVDSPPGQDPVGLDMIHMGKGLAWLNGNEIGRYWSRKASKHEKCVQQCDYRGKFIPNKCNTGCGEPTQRWYHVPRSWFKPSGNTLVIFEEKGGNPTKIHFSKRKVSSVCVHISEDHPSFDLENLQKSTNGDNKNKAIVRLKCPMSTQISGVKFASFGDPEGTCGSYKVGKCHDPNSVSMVEKVCLNKNDCQVELSQENFDMHLCPSLVKKLAVELVCS
ncbi:UNVERIFIED_CONTAM: Beta-galactosidase 3 [Sesamum indicum]